MKILSLSNDHIEQAADLFVRQFKRQRLATPLLPNALEQPENVATHLEHPCRASNGLVAIDEGRVVGYLCWFLVNNLRDTGRKGAYVPEWGNACIDENKAKIYAALYRAAGEQWAAAACQMHAITFLAHDQAAERIWFWNGFGLTVVDAIRPAQPLEIPCEQRLRIRKANAADGEAITRLDTEHREHYTRSPVFMPRRSADSAVENIEFLSRSRNSVWLAEDQGELVGLMRFDGYGFDGVAIIESENGIHITGAYVKPAYRGRKVAVALLDQAMLDYQRMGLKYCTVDFESFNPEATAFWMKHFEPVCLSVIRVPEA